ncbi:Nonsense-mediated mRNA decay protein 3 [Neolecta irregularis DAH-3]|uniref:Nonsense-mediated mRNA decay protein 3 n=1 Tax=Neolecta irregularis (strain DAH-3) TaxID=1198029 RepID=A0A1U7LNF4_NEOID|nr:Nonsense-mediated mRNA decay protein 3 [Neolecta irregularis DAH-3]|eukprot:OLL24185.1 Nonsense-mediated mRNA decay protein 3 [Neolecta irregularis DAH-3]
MPPRKAVVRRLPPLLPEAVFCAAVLPAAPGAVEDYYFRPGSAAPRRHPRPARAYITFASHALLCSFLHAFRGHVFRDKAGTEYRPVAEPAIFQKPSRPPKKTDARKNTILTDDHYLHFVASLDSLAPLQQDTPPPPPDSTPLLDYLTLQKKAQLERKAAAIAAKARSARVPPDISKRDPRPFPKKTRGRKRIPETSAPHSSDIVQKPIVHHPKTTPRILKNPKSQALADNKQDADTSALPDQSPRTDQSRTDSPSRTDSHPRKDSLPRTDPLPPRGRGRGRGASRGRPPANRPRQPRANQPLPN